MHRVVLTLAKIRDKDFQLHTACLSIRSNDICVGFGGLFYYPSDCEMNTGGRVHCFGFFFFTTKGEVRSSGNSLSFLTPNT